MVSNQWVVPTSAVAFFIVQAGFNPWKKVLLAPAPWEEAVSDPQGSSLTQLWTHQAVCPGTGLFFPLQTSGSPQGKWGHWTF